MNLLVVCTANQCRSPLTAAAFRALATQRDLPITVDSAGIGAVVGMPATAPTVEAARKLGLDLTTHTSVPADAARAAAADLVIGLERRHVQEVVLLVPGSFHHAFTLRELARRGGEVGPRTPGESVAQWIARVHKGRRPTDMLGTSKDDDIVDPTGSRAADHLTTAEEIQGLATEVVALLYPR
jgi:protein-tyrosine phosphatase